MSSRYKGTPWRETRLLRSDLKSKGIIYFLSAFQLITLNYGNCNPEINTTQLPLRHLRADQCYLYGGILQGYICGPETNQMESYGYGIAADGRRLFFLYCDNVSHNFSHRAIDASSRMAATFFRITLETKG